LDIASSLSRKMLRSADRPRNFKAHYATTYGARSEPHLDPVSIVIPLVVSVVIVIALVYLDHHFADQQHHATIVAEPATKK